MKIHDFEIIGKSLFWKKEKTLIIGDLHLGFEEVLKLQGWNIPRSQAKQTLEDLTNIFKKSGKCKEIILLGDVKHYFSGILKSEWKDFYNLLSLLKNNLLKGGKITIIKGNHDTILEPMIYQKKNDKISITIQDYYLKNSILFIHGDSKGLKKIPQIKKKNKFNLIVMGHFHPALLLKDKLGIKSERYKCFLYGKSSSLKFEIIIIPSFFPLVEGTDILSKDSKLEGWFDVSNFEVYALDDDGNAYDFGKVRDI